MASVPMILRAPVVLGRKGATWENCGWQWLTRHGHLVSAGQDPKPNWTNCNGPNARETRWLPAYPFESLGGAAGTAMGNLDEWTQKLMDAGDVPVGIVATIRASARGRPAVCWGTSGEIQINEPLLSANYTLTSIWMGPKGIFQCSNLSHRQLWPQRPYNPQDRTGPPGEVVATCRA